MNFTDLMKHHTDKMKDQRYAAIECLIANHMLITGAKINEIVLVEKFNRETGETRFSIETDNKQMEEHEE